MHFYSDSNASERLGICSPSRGIKQRCRDSDGDLICIGIEEVGSYYYDTCNHKNSRLSLGILPVFVMSSFRSRSTYLLTYLLSYLLPSRGARSWVGHTAAAADGTKLRSSPIVSSISPSV